MVTPLTTLVYGHTEETTCNYLLAGVTDLRAQSDNVLNCSVKAALDEFDYTEYNLVRWTGMEFNETTQTV